MAPKRKMRRNSCHNRYIRHGFTAFSTALAFTCIFQNDAISSGDPPPATAPASLSATSQASRIVSPPDGFVRLTVGDRTAICEPADQNWVRDCLNQAPPGTQPSTRPSDLLENLHKSQDALQSQIATQLDLKDTQAARKFLTDTLIPLSDHLNRLRVKVIYLVVTKDDLKRVVLAGWGSDQFHYNRIADKIAFDGLVDASLDGVDGESIVPAPYQSADSPDARAASLRENIGRTEAGVIIMISREAQSTLQLAIAKFITETALAPTHFKLDQNWFCAGVVGYLSSQFMAELNGAQADDIIHAIAQPDPENPVSASSIDLANPIPPDQLRPEIAGAYADAFRRRSIAIIAAWVHTAGPDAIHKTFTAIHAAPPPDGAALIALIHKTTGVDLASQLSPQ
jgi:hypothetical protein